MPPNNVIAEIRRQGVTVLMVEQNAAPALRMADRAYVMESGRIARTCDPSGGRGRLRAARGQAGYSRFQAGLVEFGFFSCRTLEGTWLS
jgi:energy-coupling factor transporter ATP-binding protein EcfA2